MLMMRWFPELAGMRMDCDRCGISKTRETCTLSNVPRLTAQNVKLPVAPMSALSTSADGVKTQTSQGKKEEEQGEALALAFGVLGDFCRRTTNHTSVYATSAEK